MKSYGTVVFWLLSLSAVSIFGVGSATGFDPDAVSEVSQSIGEGKLVQGADGRGQDVAGQNAVTEGQTHPAGVPLTSFDDPGPGGHAIPEFGRLAVDLLVKGEELSRPPSIQPIQIQPARMDLPRLEIRRIDMISPVSGPRIDVGSIPTLGQQPVQLYPMELPSIPPINTGPTILVKPPAPTVFDMGGIRNR